MWKCIRNPPGEKFFIYASFRYGLHGFGWHPSSFVLSFDIKTKKSCFFKSEASSKKRLNSCKHNADRPSSAFLLGNDKVQAFLLNTLFQSHSAFLQWSQWRTLSQGWKGIRSSSGIQSWPLIQSSQWRWQVALDHALQRGGIRCLWHCPASWQRTQILCKGNNHSISEYRQALPHFIKQRR